MSQTRVLGIELPLEIARVRDEVLPAHLDSGAVGALTACLIRIDLDRAAKALAEGDLVTMIAVYDSLKGWSL